MYCSRLQRLSSETLIALGFNHQWPWHLAAIRILRFQQQWTVPVDISKYQWVTPSSVRALIQALGAGTLSLTVISVTAFETRVSDHKVATLWNSFSDEGLQFLISALHSPGCLTYLCFLLALPWLRPTHRTTATGVVTAATASTTADTSTVLSSCYEPSPSY